MLRDSNNLVGLNLFQPIFPFHIDSSHLICTIILLTAFYMKCDTGLKLVEYYTETHLLYFSCCLFDRFYSVFIWKPYAYDTLECSLKGGPTTDISMPSQIIHKCLLTYKAFATFWIEGYRKKQWCATLSSYYCIITLIFIKSSIQTSSALLTVKNVMKEKMNKIFHSVEVVQKNKELFKRLKASFEKKAVL